MKCHAVSQSLCLSLTGYNLSFSVDQTSLFHLQMAFVLMLKHVFRSSTNQNSLPEKFLLLMQDQSVQLSQVVLSTNPRVYKGRLPSQGKSKKWIKSSGRAGQRGSGVDLIGTWNNRNLLSTQEDLLPSAFCGRGVKPKCYITKSNQFW